MKYALYTFAILSMVTISFAGPKDKNYKPWKDDSPQKIVVSKKTVNDVNGPQAKNAKAWKNEGETQNITKSDKPNMKGPQAKNYKPWKD